MNIKKRLDEFKQTYFASYTWLAVIAWLLGAVEYYYPKGDYRTGIPKVVVVRWWHPFTFVTALIVLTIYSFKGALEALAELKGQIFTKDKPNLETQERLLRLNLLRGFVRALTEKK